MRSVSKTTRWNANGDVACSPASKPRVIAIRQVNSSDYSKEEKNAQGKQPRFFLLDFFLLRVTKSVSVYAYFFTILSSLCLFAGCFLLRIRIYSYIHVKPATTRPPQSPSFEIRPRNPRFCGYFWDCYPHSPFLLTSEKKKNHVSTSLSQRHKKCSEPLVSSPSCCPYGSNRSQVFRLVN